MKRGQTRADDLSTAQRRNTIFELRKGGASYRQIVDVLRAQYGPDGLPKGYGEREAHRDVTRELARLRKDTDITALDVVQLEIERLNALLMGIWTRATGGDLGAIDRTLAIMRRMGELQGVITPVVIDWTVEVKHLLQAGIVTPAMVEEELGPDLASELFESIGIRTIKGSKVTAS